MIHPPFITSCIRLAIHDCRHSSVYPRRSLHHRTKDSHRPRIWMMHHVQSCYQECRWDLGDWMSVVMILVSAVPDCCPSRTGIRGQLCFPRSHQSARRGIFSSMLHGQQTISHSASMPPAVAFPEGTCAGRPRLSGRYLHKVVLKEARRRPSACPDTRSF
ncbi:hypothetical protein BO86DRAFT_193408 [Aspergillus japonicus CBS 114.51]|uniref:Uncharacterized protein n=1 Tax=Aspergillus japonicus CBS 114.51 TaxID=1448312 RepID=A0A8T8WRU2_ASPJA|nr:hypothetical protein BO86DRAFT_193408 [Aspergillus japonicus CBS 114.51]RAH78272.1 hypothetical protein BO86DRAFT_193408 [Aspergillus japonicus CBS 114.51]